MKVLLLSPPSSLFKSACLFLLNYFLLFRPESYMDDFELAEGLSDGELGAVATEDFQICGKKRPDFGQNNVFVMSSPSSPL